MNTAWWSDPRSSMLEANESITGDKNVINLGLTCLVAAGRVGIDVAMALVEKCVRDDKSLCV